MQINCSVTDIALFFKGEPNIVMSNKEHDFFDRYKKFNYRRATFISDPYDTHSTLNQSTIYEEYQKCGIHLNIPQNRKKLEQILKTRTSLSRIRVHERCADFISAIQNSRYPERKE